MWGGLGLGWLLISVGCGGGGSGATTDETEIQQNVPVEQGEGLTTQPVGEEALKLYEVCRDRVEGTEQEQECAQDSDCKAVGCSGELCVAAAEQEVLTSCEVLPCYRVLDECGCSEGRCRWSIRGVGAVTAPGNESPD